MPRRINPNIYTPLTPTEVSRKLVSRAGAPEVEAIPDSFLEEMAEAPDAESRMLVARHRFTPQAILRRLAEDTNRNVRCALVTNTAATDELLAGVVARERKLNPFARILDTETGTRTHLLGSASTHGNASIETLQRVREIAGEHTTAGRYARERITLATFKASQAERKRAAEA